MLLLDATNAADYLRERGRIGPTEQVRVEELSGGVSNIVLLVTRPERGESFVLKQAREQLRVPDPWFCGVERIWREVEVLRVCERVLAGGLEVKGIRLAMPRVLFEDRDQFAFAMTTAPLPHETLKAELLQGHRQPELAEACGRLLGHLHAGTWGHPEPALTDQTFFDALRIDPYYRRVAAVHSDLAPAIGDLIAAMQTERHCLVHGDYSPKNLLVSRGEGSITLTLIDCEVGHYGDPAFDLGFFLTHLVLKAIGPLRDALQPLWLLADIFLRAYELELAEAAGPATTKAVIARGLTHLAGCLLARVDGKSRVDYLPGGNEQEAVRRIARRLLADRPRGWQAVYSIIAHEVSLPLDS